jgi:hypothetical protein
VQVVPITKSMINARLRCPMARCLMVIVLMRLPAGYTSPSDTPPLHDEIKMISDSFYCLCTVDTTFPRGSHRKRSPTCWPWHAEPTSRSLFKGQLAHRANLPASVDSEHRADRTALGRSIVEGKCSRLIELRRRRAVGDHVFYQLEEELNHLELMISSGLSHEA